MSRPQRLPDGSTLFDGMLVDRTAERRTELALAAGRHEVDEMTRRLAAARFEATFEPGGAPRLVSGDAGGYDAVPDHVWAIVRRGEPAEVEGEVAGRASWIRLRPREAGGRLVVDGACFDLAPRS
jgi:hypothetical protein